MRLLILLRDTSPNGITTYNRILAREAMAQGHEVHVWPASADFAAASGARALRWLQRWGPPACLLSWLPVVGDPLCAVAGWLRLPFWPCTAYMAIGKFLRYLFYVGGLSWLFPWHGG